MEHRLDFIRRLFVVAVSVGFASRIGGMEWFTVHRWPTRPEWQAIALLAVGLAAIIESWEGYFASIGNRSQKTITRFIIDIMVAFAYMFLLLSSAYLPFFVSVMFIIFLLYVFWDISLLIEYRDEFIPKMSVVGQDRSISVISQLSRSFCDPSSSIYGMGITMSWTLYIFMICLITLAMNKNIAFVVALFTVYGLAMYGIDKNRRFSIMTRSALIFIAVLLFVVAAVLA
jgi:hypothetical protein